MHEGIWEAKQKYTLEFLHTKCMPNFIHELLMTELYKQKMTAKGVKSSLHKDLNHILYKRVAGVLNEDEKEEISSITESITDSLSILIDKKLDLFSSTVNNK